MYRKLFQAISIFVMAGLLASCASIPKLGNSSQTLASVNQSRGSDFSGRWMGLWFNNQQPTLITLELNPASADAGAYSGIAYYRTIQRYDGNMPSAALADYSQGIQVIFNPTLNTVQFAGERVRGGYNQVRINALRGVFSNRTQRIAGLVASNQPRGYANNPEYFFFTRAEYIAPIMDKYASQGMRLPPNLKIINGLFSSGVSLDEAKRWSDKAYAEYPNIDFYTMGGYEVTKIGYKLLRDEHAKRFLSKRYSDMSNGYIQTTAKRSMKRQLSAWDKNTPKEIGIGILAANVFTPYGGFKQFNKTGYALLAQDALLDWYYNRIKQIKALRANKTDLNQITTVESELSTYLQSLLWPSEIHTLQETIASTRSRLSEDILAAKLGTYENGAKTFSTLNATVSFIQTNKDLTQYIARQQLNDLSKQVSKVIDQHLSSLIPQSREQLAFLGDGAAALTNDKQWFSEFSRNYSSVLQHSQVRALKSEFVVLRNQHLQDALGAMLKKVDEFERNLPSTFAAQADRQKHQYIASLSEVTQQWFSVDTDYRHASYKLIHPQIKELQARTAYYLPPVARQSIVAKIPAVDNFFKQQVDASIGLANKPVNLAASGFTKPSLSAGADIQDQVMWSIYFGRFDQIAANNSLSNSMVDQIQKVARVNSRFHFAVANYLMFVSNKHKNRQLGRTTTVTWQTTRGDAVVRKGYGEVTLPVVFLPYYENSYKKAKAASEASATFGNGFLTFFVGLAELQKSGNFFNLGVQPDGEASFVAKWTRPISQDLGALLDYWPAQSYGLWQFQENMLRYLQGSPSLQAELGY